MSQAPNSIGRPLSIKEFAARAGLSVATVSRALQPDKAHLVQEETRRQVQTLAARWNYTPNPQARSLRNPRHPLLTIILEDVRGIFQSDYNSRVLDGVISATEARQIETRIVLVGGAGRAFLDAYHRRTAGGNAVLYLGRPLASDELAELTQDPRPIIFYKSALPRDVSPQNASLRVVGTDDSAGATLVVEHLLRLGHRRFFLACPTTMRDSRDREEAVVARLAREGIHLGPQDRTDVTFSVESGREAWQAYARHPDPAPAVICGSDEIAFGFLQAAQSAGRAQGLTVTGYDDHHLISQLGVPITSVSHDLVAMGRASVELLIEALTRPEIPAPSEWRLFPPSLIVR